VVAVDELPLEQVTKQLNKLINVIKIVELDPAAAVQRELLLVKIRADTTVRSQVLETVALFRAKVVDVCPEALTIEATGTADKLDALLRMLEPFGIREMVQSGMVAMGRGPRAITGSSSKILITLISLLSCLVTCSKGSSSTATTMVIREMSWISVGPTASEWMLNPRRLNNPDTRASTPGLFSTRTDMVCVVMTRPRQTAAGCPAPT